MRSIVLVAAYLACAGHAQQVKHAAEHRQDNGEVPDFKALATLLLALKPESAFTPSGPGTQPVTAIRNAGVKMFTNPDIKRSSTPLMQDDAASSAEEELLKNQQKIEELQAQVSASKPEPAPAGRKSIGQSDIVLVQGDSLKTWTYQTSVVDRVQVVLTSDGRPLDADVQLWQGPDNTPCKMRVYSEDGSIRPFSAVITTPDDSASTVAVRNVGQVEFPLAAYVVANDVDEPISDFKENAIIVQGGALRTFDFNTAVESVEVMIKTDGRPLNARIELLQGPNNIKQVIELYTEDGLLRPFFAILDTIGSGNVVRLVNTAPLEFPMMASVQPHTINEDLSPNTPIIGGSAR